MLPSIEPLKSLALMEGFYREELLELAEINNELFLKLDDLSSFTVKGKVSLLDILKAKRIFSFIACGFNRYLKSYLETNPTLVFRSLIPLMRGEHLRLILAAIMGEEKAEDWLQLMSWQKEDEKVLDLQYTPLIPVGNHFFFLQNLLASSNTVRNCMYSERVRVFHEGTRDPLSITLEGALIDAGFEVARDVKVKYKNLVTDIDVLVKAEDILFFFECKNSLLPGNTAELRTSFDYIEKASTQLSNVVERLAEPEFVNHIFTKAGFSGSATVVDHRTCIVFGNRTFYGYRHNSHPIIPLQELLNYITSGEITLNGEAKLVRPSGRCSSSMLSKFLDDTPFQTANLSALIEQINIITFRDKVVKFKSYSIDEKILSEKLPQCIGNFFISLS